MKIKPWLWSLLVFLLAGCQPSSPVADPVTDPAPSPQPSASPAYNWNDNSTFTSTSTGCSNCHTADDGSFQFRGQRRFHDLPALISFIELNMPGANPSACAGVCATEIGNLLWQHQQARLEQPSTSLAQWQLMTPEQTLEKAALRLAGRLPSLAERRNASRGDQQLADELRKLMQGPAFDAFLMESANDLLLVRKWHNNDSGGINSLSSQYHTTGLDPYLEREQQLNAVRQEFEQLCNSSCQQQLEQQSPAIREAHQHWQQRQQDFYQYRQQLTQAVADQPLRLLVHLVAQERPYSEWLTADYVMLNPISAQWAADTSLQFTNPEDLSVFLPGQIRHYRPQVQWQHNGQTHSELTHYPERIPQAGLLSSIAFLARYPSTETNRNRMRSSALYRLFLGLDIESLASRPMDQEVLNDNNNPTLNNPACAQCHSLMDPVAGAFMSWGNDGIYRERNGKDSLPWNYVYPGQSERLYQPGDHWYQDMRQPGFVRDGLALPLPSSSSHGPYQGGDALQWLAVQVVDDPRFALQAVRTWYWALFGLSPEHMLADSTAGQARLALLEQQLSQDFIASNMNLKDLLVQLLLLPEFRALAPLNSEAEQMPWVGSGRLLSPEQLSRKLKAITNWDWSPSWNASHDHLLAEYYLLFGGMDSDNITERAQQLDPIMLNVLQRLGNELSCPIVLHEFDQRRTAKLFAGVNPLSQPDTPEGQAGIRQGIQQLVRLLWQQALPLDHPEVEALYQLYVDVWTLRQTLREQTDKPQGWGNQISYSQLWDNQNHSVDWDEVCYTHVDYAWDQVNWQDPRQQLGYYYNPEQSVRAWMSVLNVMLADPQFIYD